MAQSWRRLIFTIFLMNLLTRSLVLAEISQRSFAEEDDEAVLVRKTRQSNSAGYNSFVNIADLFLSALNVIPTTNTAVTNASTLTISTSFWTTFFYILQYLTFFVWFVMVLFFYVGGVIILFLFAIVSPASTDYLSNGFFNGALFRSFEDENMPLFDKVTSVGYGFLDRTSELYKLATSPQCSRYAMCHLSSTLGDQEANGFIFKDLLRSLSSAMDNKMSGFDGMSRSVNVGLLTGDCEEPMMSCPELAPYFKKVAETWSNYL
ncbi:uncharacterized protein LOC129600433 [Paramacrobiotus metropolitanus]|uniref:uncharacterized protein LOC129600433 n=1 Tax=Paramacrobiotus metropolitanus TaxID=2943436 RepID=UPI0024458F2C|nr:uncharacterized protein LOC129600433 [Paramacrobiotus metropolitanus]XP_055354914.1 uncharacterized protein LOC129600433 [Paramacrobiotus metropolitanus]